METASSHPDQRPPSPELIAPREAEVVNGREVTFAWGDVDGADAHRLQIAATATFDDVLFEETLDAETTAVTVADLLPTDEQTFFWRVLTRIDETWSRGERVESLVATTPATAEAHGASASDEDMGPVTELVRAAKRDLSEKLLDTGPGRLEKEKEMGVAHEGIAAGQIAAIAVAILLVVGIAAVIVFVRVGLTAQSTQDAAVDPGNYTELQQTEIDAARQLERYDVVSEEDSVYRIPIDRAMDIIANEAYQESQLRTQSGAAQSSAPAGASAPGPSTP